MLLLPPGPPGLLAAAEPSDMLHRSSNPPPLDFVADVVTEEVVPALRGDFVADREDMGLMTGVALYPTALAGVELGRACGDDGESRVLKVPKVWGWVGCAGVYVAGEWEGAPDARRSMRLGLAGAVTGAIAEGTVAVAVAGGEGGAA
jgi:hypothetical protein